MVNNESRNPKSGRTSSSCTLVFEPLTGSHRSEWISHLIEYIRCNPSPDKHYTFIVGEGGRVEEDLPPGVTVHEITSEQVKMLRDARGPFSGFVFRRVLDAWLQKIQPDHLVIMDMTWLEFPLCFRRLPCSFDGILMVQYPELRAVSGKSWKRKLKFWWKELKTQRFLRFAKPRHMYLLNGTYSCDYLNRRFSVSCYFPIPDPVPHLVAESGFDVREHYRIGEEARIFLFFGSMSPRKGVDLLTNVLLSLSKEAAEGSAFIFCGAPEPAYAATYHTLIAHLKQARPDVHLTIDEQFVSSPRMRALFEQTDWVVMPYTRPEYSSGILIHAAAAATPVLGSKDGLLGRQIRELGLGWAVDLESLSLTIEKAVKETYTLNEETRRSFVETSHPDNLAKAILGA